MFTGQDCGYLAGILVVLVLMPAALIVSGLIMVCGLSRYLPEPGAGGELLDPAFGPDRWPHARWPGRLEPKWGPPLPIWGITPDPRVRRASYGHSKRT